jgi:carbamoyltransferase
MNVVLGLNLFGHDTSTALVRESDGEVIFALAEERLNNIKHSINFPIGGVESAKKIISNKKLKLTKIGINVLPEKFISQTLQNEIIRICGQEVGVDISKKILALLEYEEFFDINIGFIKDCFDEILNKFNLDKIAKQEILGRSFCYFNWAVNKIIQAKKIKFFFPDTPYYFFSHHECHASSAFFSSGFKEATIITIDGHGESESHTVSHGSINGIKKIAETLWPNSLGLLYWLVRNHLGFDECDEYKVMGMAASGKPTYYDFFKSIVSVTESGTIAFNSNNFFQRQEVANILGHFYFDFTQEINSILPKRNPSDEINQNHFNFACSIQRVTEEIAVQLVETAIHRTNCGNVCLAGGVAQNGLMNEKIRKSKLCKSIFIYPAPADDGSAVGAAQLLAFKTNSFPSKKVKSVYYGINYTAKDCLDAIESLNVVATEESDIHKKIALLISDGSIVARFFSKSEFGPRALGHRSILADPRNRDIKDTLNKKIKHSESFRVYASSCLVEKLSEYFHIEKNGEFMELIVNAKEDKISKIPGVIHIDGSARVQSVDKNENFDLYKTIAEFYAITEIPVLLNTSFNVSGEAIVETPQNAIESFLHMDIDFLALDNYLISKKKNIRTLGAVSDQEFIKKRRDQFKVSFNSYYEKI